MDNVDIHGIRVFGPGGCGSEGLVRMLSRALVPSGDFLCSFPLSLEVDGFGIPLLNGGRYVVHGHDLSHEGGRYSCGEVSDENTGIFDVGSGNVVLEFGDVLVQRGRISSIFLEDHSLGCKPGDGSPGNVPLFEVLVELGNEVHVGS